MLHCDRCAGDAITLVRYNGSHLCSAHFIEFVEKRVKRELREQIDLADVRTIAIAVSGGKDSCSALMLVHDILKDRRDVSVHAITVDEGIAGYRPRSIEKVRDLCSSLNIPHHIISFKEELGIEMDEVSTMLGERTPCAYCGVFRRRCMNAVARDIGADVIATGHNLDDTAQAVLMNFTRGDIERLARLGPHTKIQPRLVPRIMPLRRIPENETYLYALLKGIDFSDEVCPYWEAALRNEYRDIIDRMENRSPGTKFSILTSYDAIRPLLKEKYPQSDLGSCSCGEPTPGERCMACELLDEIKKRGAQRSS